MVTKVRFMSSLFFGFSLKVGWQRLLLQNALDPNMTSSCFVVVELDKILLHVSLNRCRLVRFSFYLAVAGLGSSSHQRSMGNEQCDIYHISAVIALWEYNNFVSFRERTLVGLLGIERLSFAHQFVNPHRFRWISFARVERARWTHAEPKSMYCVRSLGYDAVSDRPTDERLLKRKIPCNKWKTKKKKN